MSIDYPICEICEYYPGGDSYCPITAHYCEGCESEVSCSRFRQKTETVFDRITASPEVLAPKFVYHVTSFLDGLDRPKKIWYSTIIQGRFFDTETEAKRATVAKLREVAE